MSYVLIGQVRGWPPLTEGIAFGTMSLFELLDQPLMYIIDGMEDVQTILNSFNRIQEYLVSAETPSYRLLEASSQPESSSSSTTVAENASEKSLKDTDAVITTEEVVLKSDVLVSLTSASARYAEDAKPILSDITLQVPSGKVVMIYGPVGAGKSTFLKLLLGEMPFTAGVIQTSFHQSAYSPQSPWCIWGTVRENIVGMSPWDEKWYHSVIAACSLGPDIAQLPLGDRTIVGTRGTRLSGGQQTRMSLARSLYSRQKVMLLDDPLSGLDGKTELNMLEAIFNKDGCLKRLGSSIVMATSSLSHLHYADHIIVLDGQGNVTSQGTMSDVGISLAANDVSSHGEHEAPSDKIEISEETLQELELIGDESRNTALKSGDIKTYIYFAKVAGYFTISLYLLASAVFVFGITFPCKHNLALAQCQFNANSSSHLGPVVDQLQRRAP